MKNIQNSLVIIAVLALAFTACKNNQAPKTVVVESSEAVTEASFKDAKQMAMNIEGMMCAVGCAATIEKNLNKTEGIKSAKVDFETKKATLTFDAELLNPNEVTQVVLNTGEAYSVTDIELID